jgi:hypothetical protein
MKKHFGFVLIFNLLISSLICQEWVLKFSSTVEKDGKLLAGANISLFKGSSKVSEVSSDGKGDFVMDVPANGDYMLVVSYPGCNAKKFQISTLGLNLLCA